MALLDLATGFRLPVAIDDVSHGSIRHSRIIKSAAVSDVVEIYDPISLTASFIFSGKIYNSWVVYGKEFLLTLQYKWILLF